MKRIHILQTLVLAPVIGLNAMTQVDYPAAPDTVKLRSAFSKKDKTAFLHPDRIYYPETWFHFVNGNVSRNGITRDLEAIAESGIQGIQLFHGRMSDDIWPGTEEPIECLTPKWESLVRHTATEAHRLGMRFSLQTCPGWAMSGGPWIEPEQAMRHLSYSRTDVTGGKEVAVELPVPQKEDWRDWQDIAVLAFPTPQGDTDKYCQVKEVEAEEHLEDWKRLLSGERGFSFTLEPTTSQNPHRFRVRIQDDSLPLKGVGGAVRSIEFNPIDRFNHEFGVQPDIHLRVLTPNGVVALDTDFPHANWQDDEKTMTFALPDLQERGEYILEITNLHPMRLSSLRFSTATRGHNWEMEAGWTSRWLLRLPENMNEDGSGFVKRADIVNLTDRMSPDGKLRWNAPDGQWTVLRIGHVNTGRENGPAPKEATGWEVNKLDSAYVAYQFRSYIGRLADGPLKGLVNNMLMDSWECSSQTWTRYMQQEFLGRRHYDMLDWMPAIFGWVVDNRQQTSKFLSDWRRTINELFTDNFYGQMTRLAHEKGMTVSYETAAGDIFPGDPMEFYKYADVPMTEYWQPIRNWLANHNYKPIRVTASAARMYGKPRVSAESFTSFELTWDESLSMLREVANQNMVEGVTHTVFHTYTHNPDADRYFPGTSFGGGIGTPFLRKQTWWPYMRHFNTYLARCAFMLERGLPVSSILWYIGDEIEQKPDQYAPFPEGYAYDYCNTDAFLHRISVRDGRWTTPEGIAYDVLWIPDTKRLLPETANKLQAMAAQGGRIIRDVSLSELGRALEGMGLQPDVKPAPLRWLHRYADKADWYMVCPRPEQSFSGEVSFRQKGRVELWNPMNGSTQPLNIQTDGDYTRVHLDLQRGEMVFLVWTPSKGRTKESLPIEGEVGRGSELLGPWTLTFPEGWGIDKPLQLTELKAWKDLPLSDEGRAFSGTATYETTFQIDRLKRGSKCLLRLGEVEKMAIVSINGQTADTLWAAPYQTDITPYLRRDTNTIAIQVTSTWFNRLVYDAGLPQEQRRTWVISGPAANQPLRPSGLLGPVEIVTPTSALSSGDDTLLKDFKSLPEDQRVAVYWYWISDNISVEGVQHDLEAMKKAGIGRAFIGHIWQDDVKPGNIKVLSPEWWEVLHAALKKATELDIEIGLFNCPGWSQSGGPWIEPQQSMRYLAQQHISVEGNGTVQHISLPEVGKDSRDVRVVAVPALPHKSVVCEMEKEAGVRMTKDIHLDEPMTLRSVLFETPAYLLVDAILEAKVSGEYKTLRTEHLDRTNHNPNVGFHPLAPISLSIPDVTAQDFRLTLNGGGQPTRLMVTLSEQPLVERYEEKSLGKMFQSPLPMWDWYMWPTQPEPLQAGLIVQPQKVIDLTEKMQENGILEWKVPAGEWTIYRTAMLTTGVTNAPASPEATGLEVDKMSQKHVKAHFDAFMGEILRHIPAQDRKSLVATVEDSYEMGGQNWTDDMIPVFRQTYGYDPIPWLPVMYGQVVGSQDQSERFLWDLRRLVADRVAYDYVAGLRKVSNQHGLTTWLECYGHWGFPGEFLMYGGQSDEVAGEFWSEGSLGDIENRAASSCAHIYGKQKVWAESCTAGGPPFYRYPAMMKQRTDRFFCEGINATLLHLFIQQPDDTTFPGISAGFGNEFNRKNTWFQQMDLFTDYLRRCNLMLQQGRYIADVAYFIGEDTPKMTGETKPALPRGYSFDYINAEVLKQSTVKNGCLCLPGGMQYHVLVLPQQKTMRPEVLKAIEKLVKQGLNILGPKPTASPSMQNYPKCDQQVRQMAEKLYAAKTYGKGRVYADGTELQTVLDELGIRPDCHADQSVPYAFIHRSQKDRDIYFVSNQSDQPQTFDATFRIQGKAPDTWDPVTGEKRQLPQFQQQDGQTIIPLHLEPYQSLFVVFDTPVSERPASQKLNYPNPTVLAQIDTPWTVSFQSEMRGPAEPQTFSTLTDWSQSQDDAIKYYAGKATYTNTFHLDKLPNGDAWLDLGRVMVMARVYVNEQYAGGVWTYPYRVPVSQFLKQGKNQIRIEVVNNWRNRLIGDARLPESLRKTYATVNPYDANSSLQESGLLGPVKIVK